MRSQRFGIEIEMTGITRAAAAKVIAGHFDTTATHVGGFYDSYSVRDNQGRKWKVMSDSSIHAETRSGSTSNTDYKVEFVSPICRYEDIKPLQEIIRKLRTSGAKVNDSCGIHVHVDASNHNVKTLRNIVNIMAAKEDLLYKALKVEVERQYYCQKADIRFLESMNNRRPKSWNAFGTTEETGETLIMTSPDIMRLTSTAYSTKEQLSFVSSIPHSMQAK